MKKRISDSKNIANEDRSFTRRKIKPGILSIAIYSIIAFGLVFLAILQIEKFGSITTMSIVASIFLLLLIIIIMHMDKVGDVIFSNEFENALFAGAAGIGVEFMLIIKNNNQIVYYNPSCRKYFPYQPHSDESAFGSFLASLGISDAKANKLSSAIKNHENAKVAVTLKAPTGETHKLIFLLDPMSRPKGYFLLKALKEVGNTVISTSNKSDDINTMTTIAPGTYLSLMWDKFIEKSPIAIILLEENGNIIENNASFRRIIQDIFDGKNNQNLFKIFDSQSRPNASRLFIEVKTDNTSNGGPVDVTIEGKTNHKASLFITPFDKIGETGRGYIAYLIDTTEQKALEGRVIHSQKMQAVGQLAGGIAHDFNNLLTAMIGFCDLLLTRHPPGEQSFADIMQIKQNANRAANLVRQLLAFSRKQTLQPKIIDITDTLAELSNLVRRLIGENIELKMNHGRDIWRVRVDQGQLEQVIINLAVNARDAMSDGGSLTIQTINLSIDENYKRPQAATVSAQDNRLEKGDYVVVEVIDTGHGMSEDTMSQIFEPFFTTKEVGEGTGLGLATVYGIVQQTGGHIFVSSKKGHGTKFSMFFKRIDDADIVKEAREVKEKEIISDLTGTGTILLVEDEDPVRIFSSRALQNKGYNILEADCGEAALQHIDEQGDNIDLIITDVVMPGITGPSMVKQIIKQYPNMKVIFISGYAEDAFIKTYGSEREFFFLPKPFTLNQLASKVKEVMDRKQTN